MELTLFNAAPQGRRGRQGWTLNSQAGRIQPPEGRAPFKTSRKAVSLLLLLAARRLDDSSQSALGWVSLADVSALPEWAGARTSSSLAAQVRREIKGLHLVSPGLVDSPQGAKLKGPFRLSQPPRVDRPTRLQLAQIHAPIRAHGTVVTSETLYSRLEQTEPVWRAGHYFDKPGEAMSSLPTAGNNFADDPLPAALAWLGSAKRFRELGAYRNARRALASAAAAAAQELQVPVRQYLQAACALQHAWLDYRQGDLDSAERHISVADTLATNGALLKLRGQLLNLRSLIRRSRRQYGPALDDLRHAARLFVVDGDLFHLFAVYHNLACLVADQAGAAPSKAERSAMLRTALTYSQRNEAYCRRYGVGRNSVLNKLLQIALHRKLGNLESALTVATEAEHSALDSQNFPDAMNAHRHRIGILLEGDKPGDAQAVHHATLEGLTGALLRRRFSAVYELELAKFRDLPHPARGHRRVRL